MSSELGSVACLSVYEQDLLLEQSLQVEAVLRRRLLRQPAELLHRLAELLRWLAELMRSLLLCRGA